MGKKASITIRVDKDTKDYINKLPISESEFVRSAILDQIQKESPEEFIVRQKEKKRLALVRQKEEICKTISKLDAEITELKSISKSQKDITQKTISTNPRVIKSIETMKDSIERIGYIREDILKNQAKKAGIQVDTFKKLLEKNDTN